MSPNIKNQEVDQLATALAELTGQSKTAVVLNALRIHHDALTGQQKKVARINELMIIGRRCADHINKPVSALAHGEMLYDEQGLPQ